MILILKHAYRRDAIMVEGMDLSGIFKKMCINLKYEKLIWKKCIFISNVDKIFRNGRDISIHIDYSLFENVNISFKDLYFKYSFD